MAKKSKKNNKKWLWYALGMGLVWELLKVIFQRKRLKDIGENFTDFIKEEKREIKELESGQEGWRKFFYDSSALVRDFFIPNKNNNHKPKILRSRSLIAMILTAVFLKMTVLGYLFLIYPQGAQMSADLAKQITELTNRDRAAQGLPPLRIDPVLNASALERAKDLIMRNYFSHISPDGKKPWDWIDRAKYPYLYVGENLAMNFITAEAVEKALMDSPSHRKNILNKRYKDMGVAVVSGMLDGKQTNVLVELFASRASHYLASTETQTAGTTKKIAIRPSQIEKQDKTSPRTPPPTKPKKLATNNQPEKADKTIITKGIPTVKQFTSVREEKVAAAELAPKPETTLHQSELISEFTRRPTLVKAGLEPNLEISQGQFSLRKAIGIGEKGVAALIVTAAHYLMLGILGLMVLALLVNIFVRVRVQHKPVIIQTVIAILFIGSLIYFKFHILEFGLTEILLI